MSPVPGIFKEKPVPPPSLRLLLHPASDDEYVHFQPAMADGSLPQPAHLSVPFEPSTAAFSRTNAWWLADAALLSYWNEAEATRRFLDQAGLEARLVDRDGTQCYVAWSRAFAIVAFRGTQPGEGADLLADLNFFPTTWPLGGNVHRGFKQALDVVWDDVSDLLRRADATNVWFTGHSLGGAAATLAADRFGRAAGLYTFGSPRVGDRAFVAAFNGRHSNRSFRYVNDIDQVTTLPPPALHFDHVDREVHFPKHTDELSFAAVLLPRSSIDHTPRRYATFAWNDFVTGGGLTASVRV